MGKKGRPLRPGEKLSEIKIPHPPDNTEDEPTSNGWDIWKVITDPKRPDYAVFWFDRVEGETLNQIAPFRP